MKRKLFFLHALGVLAAILLGVLLMYAVQQRPEQVNSALTKKTQKCQIQWSPEILVYDGTSELDIMQGVLVTDEDGNDRTSDARAVLQNTEQLNQKMIYYSLNGYSEKLTDQGRMLLLENYTGPTIQVDSEVQLTVTQLGNLPGVLAERKQLEADNGYGKEITGQVSWYREKTAEGEYSIFFTVSNEFGDVATAQCRAYIDGVKDDIVLTLRQEQISISQNEPFVPLDWVLEAEDANGENLIDGVEVEGTVNSSVPGNYTITYRLTSLDGRQCATRNLSVKVNETA
ncbi:immunoglobulin-like domain-containing protein [Pseudoflavonifractor sp. SW1122]|uniref:immunoglobulin-like domain-containing protein n=1 Tax=Pseudoflavonifractor sp. SW1122 TaxID=2530044 RepID=UPI00143C2FDB|nr:immunoglobulin-like domain-containing protein [Pseudoflavonifractor sp. SW1122]